VDTPVLGRRERDSRNQFELPAGIEMRNLNLPPAAPGEYESPMVRFVVTGCVTYWRDVEWFAKAVQMPVFVGRPPSRCALPQRQACLGSCLRHGGRQLDGAITTLDALPEIVSAMRGSDLDVIVDGGIRRGTDVVKALALGAKMVLVGRPVLCGLAVDGEAGARAVLDLLRREIDTTLALVGCPRPVDLSPDYLTRR
jgi:4-hydroxymandelate oxidase